MIENPIVFISYSWDDDEVHKEWVLNLANRLRTDGVDVILDRYHLQPGANVSVFVEESIRKSNRIIIVLTPNYKQKAEKRIGGVGREYALINSHLAGNISKNERVIPIIKTGSRKESVIDFLQQYLYIDFSTDSEFESKYEELVRELYKEPEIKIPELGKRPKFGDRKPIEVVRQNPNPTPTPAPKRGLRDDIRKLVADGRVKQALDKMEDSVNKNSDEGKDTYNAITILKAKFRKLNKEQNMGIISSADASITGNQINYTILNLLDEMYN